MLDESPSTRTDTAGRFTLRNVAAGNHTVLFRRIGYRSVEYRWSARAGVDMRIAVTLTPIPRQLDRVVVEAPPTSRRRGTSSIEGVVLDSLDLAVGGADVRLLGSGLSTVTDSSGHFKFAKIASGPYMLRARRRGWSSRNYIMQVADADDRAITLKLSALPRKTGTRDTATASGYGSSDDPFDAFDRRERSLGNPMLGPGDLFRADGASMDVVLQAHRDAAAMTRRVTIGPRDARAQADDGDCLIIDGRRAAYQPLRLFTSREIQLVEVIRRHATADPWLVTQMESFKECRGTMDDHPVYFILWTRFLR